jgi:hypothetical protein
MQKIHNSHLVAPADAAFMRVGFTNPAGQAIPYFPADERLAKRLVGLGMIRKDLEKAATYLTSALRLPNDDETQLRWHGAVIAYGRCFVSADGRGLKLEQHHLKDFTPEEKTAHARTMALRHQYVAHSGKNEEQQAMAVVLLSGVPSALAVDQVLFFDLAAARPAETELKDFLSLVESLMTAVETLFDVAEKTLVKHYLAKTPEELQTLLQTSIGRPTRAA